jgi:hypothetical protein
LAINKLTLAGLRSSQIARIWEIQPLGTPRRKCIVMVIVKPGLFLSASVDSGEANENKKRIAILWFALNKSVNRLLLEYRYVHVESFFICYNGGYRIPQVGLNTKQHSIFVRSVASWDFHDEQIVFEKVKDSTPPLPAKGCYWMSKDHSWIIYSPRHVILHYKAFYFCKTCRNLKFHMWQPFSNKIRIFKEFIIPIAWEIIFPTPYP